MCVCDPIEKDGHKYIKWIGQYFFECVYTEAEIWSFVMGTGSIVIWMFATFPQVWENYKLKRVEALSFPFLLQWLTGDITNLLGCIWTHQLPTQTYTGVYYVAMDVILVGQYVYYTHIRKQNHQQIQHHDKPNRSPSPLNPMFGIFMGFFFVGTFLFRGGLSPFPASSAMAATASSAASRVLLSSGKDLCNPSPDLSHTEYVAGSVSSWVSAALYFFSRSPQIYKNYKRKSLSGLSVGMFILTISGNVTYGLSILFDVPTIDSNFFASTLPFLVGSLGTLVFDVTIIVQYFLYKDMEPVDDKEEILYEPL